MGQTSAAGMLSGEGADCLRMLILRFTTLQGIEMQWRQIN
jgi:hypothetical protein